MNDVLRIAHLRIALHVANPEVGNREVHPIHRLTHDAQTNTQPTG